MKRILLSVGVLIIISACSILSLNRDSQSQSEASQGAIFDVTEMEDQLSNFVIRDEDLPDNYRLPPEGEFIITTQTLMSEMGELQGKQYVSDTGRVSGWGIELEREYKEDFAPYAFESRVELFETSQGAELALSSEWFPAYQGESDIEWVEEGCDLGDECLFYYIETYDAASQITKERYEVAFRYSNVLIWIMGRGLDIDVSPEYVLDAAQTLYDKLDAYAQNQ
jgi:hypothetical protein